MASSERARDARHRRSTAACLFVHIKIDPLFKTNLGGERISYSF